MSLDKRKLEYAIETSLFSVGGENPETGKEILEVNDYDEDVREVLEIAFNQGKFVGFNMEDIILIKKAALDDSNSEYADH